MAILEMKHISKAFSGVYANEDVDLSVEKGEIHALLGENGAGKTTLMNILFGIYTADTGEIYWKDKKVVFDSPREAINQGIGMVHQHFSLVQKMTVLENIILGLKQDGLFLSKMDARKSIVELAEKYGLRVRPDARIRDLSVGEQQRVEILKALYRNVDLLILDEPTNGLDPAGMKQIRDLLKMLCTEYGITIVVSSHILSEIESIADTIGVINHGVLMKEVTMKEISEMSLAYIELSVINTKKASYVLADKMGLDNFKIVEDGKIRIYDHHISTQELSKVLALNDVEIVAIGKKAETLEDYFLKMTAEV